MQIENKNYSCIDIIKFLMSFFVVAIHIQPFVAFEQLSFYRFYDSMLRLAVPFFFMVTGFFLTKKMKKLPQDKWASVFFDAAKKKLRLYLIWTLIYFPLAVYGFVFIQHCSFAKAVVRYVLNLFFVGENYNSWILWYLLSAVYALMFFGILLKYNCSLKICVVAGIFVYMLGLGFDAVVHHFSDLRGVYILMAVFRNGRLATGFGFIGAGIIMANCKLPSLRVMGIGFAVSFLAYAFFEEYTFAQTFLFIASLCFFRCILLLPICTKNKNLFLYFRECSSVLYFLHLLIWTLYYEFVFNRNPHGLEPFVVTISICMIIATFWFVFKNWYKKNRTASKLCCEKEMREKI